MAPTEAAQAKKAAPRSRTTPSAGTGAGATSTCPPAKDLAKVLSFKETLDRVATASASDLRAALDGLRALGPPDVHLLKTSSIGRSLNQVAKVASDTAIRESARELVEEWKQACRKRKHEEDASGNRSVQKKVAQVENVANTRPSQAKQQQTVPKQECLVIGSSGDLVQSGAESSGSMSWEAWAMAAREFIVRLPGDPPVPELGAKNDKPGSPLEKEKAHKPPLSPETQEAHKLPLSPEPQESHKFPTSPETQAMVSPAPQDAHQLPLSPETLEANIFPLSPETQVMRSAEPQEAHNFPLSPETRVMFSPETQEAHNFPLSPDTRVLFSPELPLSPDTRVMLSPEPQEAHKCPLSPETQEAHMFPLSPDPQLVLSLEPQDAQKDEFSPEKQEAHTFVSSPGEHEAHKSESSTDKEKAHSHPGKQNTQKNEPSAEKQEAQSRT